MELLQLPTEILNKILLEVALSEAHSTKNNTQEVYRGLAVVCGMWKDIVETDHFQKKFVTRLAKMCK